MCLSLTEFVLVEWTCLFLFPTGSNNSLRWSPEEQPKPGTMRAASRVSAGGGSCPGPHRGKRQKDTTRTRWNAWNARIPSGFLQWKKVCQRNPEKGESEGLCSLFREVECQARKHGGEPAVLIGAKPLVFVDRESSSNFSMGVKGQGHFFSQYWNLYHVKINCLHFTLVYTSSV